jgi:hypothetical protein
VLAHVSSFGGREKQNNKAHLGPTEKKYHMVLPMLHASAGATAAKALVCFVYNVFC